MKVARRTEAARPARPQCQRWRLPSNRSLRLPEPVPGCSIFPEAYLPGFRHIWRLRPGGDMALSSDHHARLRASAVDLAGDDLRLRCRQRHSMARRLLMEVTPRSIPAFPAPPCSTQSSSSDRTGHCSTGIASSCLDEPRNAWCGAWVTPATCGSSIRLRVASKPHLLEAYMPSHVTLCTRRAWKSSSIPPGLWRGDAGYSASHRQEGAAG